MSIRQKIVSLAQKISGTETAFTENDPEYYALECLVTDEMADLAMHMDLRVPISAKKLSAKSGKSLRGNEPAAGGDGQNGCRGGHPGEW